MKFTYDRKRETDHAAQRSVAMGPRGMVASSQQLATLAGYNAMLKGGNAVDAAVAMVSTLSVVEPFSVGIGGDAFALMYLAEDNKMVGMNASGRSPHAVDPEWYHQKGMKEIPRRGILSVSVPGALHGWAEAVARFGKLKLGDILEDAIFYASRGFPVTEVIAGEWHYFEGVLLNDRTAADTYLLDGKAPRPGQVFVNKELAETYRKIAEGGIDAFYGGEIRDALVKYIRRQEGLLSQKDFEDHTTTWVEPIMTDYRGYRIYELPPNGQGITAIQMLNMLEGYDVAEMGHNSPEYLHYLIEAKKIAFSDRDSLVADPEFADIPMDRLLSKEYAAQCRKTIHGERTRESISQAGKDRHSDTVYVAAVDEQRNAVSFISSLFMPFGSGKVLDGTGVILQNRGSSFSLDPSHPNRLEPGKRPLHTIIPGMVFRDGRFLMCFGVMGGDMQPQGHTQFLVNLIDFNMNLQEAVDAPRVRHIEGQGVYLEKGIPESVVLKLQEKGHQIARSVSPVNEVGGGQAIYLDHGQNVLLGASDRRKDGAAIAY
ncbi:MAG: gamma-glutamyltransferase [Deltaproteobacteria bacterium]|nr:gamma-glutamyltransferase [Deltaproteobacteria bacterium]